MKRTLSNEMGLSKKLKRLGVEFEPPDDWHGAYYVYHQKRAFPWADGEDKPYYKPDEFVWIPGIDDCLEWLKGKCKDHVFLSHDEEDTAEWFVWVDEYQPTQVMGKGKTPLEALLRAVLEILNNEKISE